MKKIIVFVFFLYVGSFAFSQEKLSDFIDAVASKINFNGTILIERENKVVFNRSYGFANLEWKQPGSIDTKYKVASITKFFTAVLIMQLVEENKVGLDMTIPVYIPTYKGDKTITIRQLLNHSSGMKNIDTISSVESAVLNGVPLYQTPRTAKELLEKFCSEPVVAKPGSEFNYNNADYIVLGNIIEAVSGKSYGEVLRQRILEPLRMSNTGLLSQHILLDKLASSYFKRDDLKKIVPDLPAYWENWYAAGAMYSTSADLLIFSKAVFGGKILKKASLDSMFVSGKGEYGFGVWVYNDYEIDNKKYTIVKRPGQIMGAQSVLFHILETGLTIIILSNTGFIDIDGMVADLAVQASRVVN
ncbi:serine hydrolase domain-containing protein [Flavihumibacter sp. UBA7668]|uniref:serine hydrolase domain-containing protein n=1 Tax=Flavihumibacter sp. UBA7668 TaxID=1946542 RepID=UPI0025BC8BA7|nr:serine hydrolase domain-containing protein [Flavihumibacter sp. UBA7668]